MSLQRHDQTVEVRPRPVLTRCGLALRLAKDAKATYAERLNYQNVGIQYLL